MGHYAIKVDGLGKQYRLGAHEGKRTYKSIRDVIAQTTTWPIRTAGNIIRGEGSHYAGKERFWALQDVSFELEPGEVLGVIGRNGAGKSTLLKLLTRITEPTTGEIRLRGRVGSLLEVGTGFHPELTGRENVYLNGAVLGMKRHEITRKFDEIVDFAGVERFVDTPVKRYSSGMYLRLAFAVAAHLETEILLVDEVLAVGDAEFQKKCLGKMSAVASTGRTVLFVSHNMAAIEQLCTTGIVLNTGYLVHKSDRTAAINHYLRIVSEVSEKELSARQDRSGSGMIKVSNIEICDISGTPLDNVVSGQNVIVRLYYEASVNASLENVIASVGVKTQQEVPVFLQHNRLSGDNFSTIPPQGVFSLRINELPLPPSIYNLDYSLIQNGQILDALTEARRFTVIDGNYFRSGEVPPISHGVALVRGQWSVEAIR